MCSDVIFDGSEVSDPVDQVSDQDAAESGSKSEKQKEKNVPDRVFKSGSVKLVVWENTAGDGGTFHTFELRRNYQDKDGDWQKTGSMRVSDLPHVLSLVRRAVQVYGVEERFSGRGGGE